MVRTALALALAFTSMAGGVGCNGDPDAPASDGGADGDASHQPHDPPDGSSTDPIDGAVPEACDVTAPTSCPDPSPTYADVEPIFQARCVGCHFGMPNGPWPLTSYAHVASWFGEIRGAMLNCAMPPPNSGISMSTDEREEILTWIRCGFPQ